MIDQGKYRGTITKWGLGKAKTGNPQFQVSFELKHKIGAGGAPEDCPNWERTIFRSITEKTIDYLVEDLQRLGYDRDNFDGLDPEGPQAFNFAGIEVDVECDHETWEGKKREKWRFNAGGGAPAINPLERKEVSQLNALYSKKLKGGNGASPAAKPTAAAVNTTAQSSREEMEEHF